MKIEVQNLLPLIHNAGQIIARHFEKKTYLVQNKSDNSPVTTADIESNQYLVDELSRRFPYPVISEETHSGIKAAMGADAYWLLDPLDGTQAFIKHSPEFSINLALVDKSGPTIGVIHAPATKETWFAQKGKGAFYTAKPGDTPMPLPSVVPPTCAVIKSRLFDNEEVSKWMQENDFSNVLKISSAIKFGYVAMGKASVYLRYCTSYEWDVAAGHIIVKEAGGAMKTIPDKVEMKYLKPDLRNGAFIAYSKAVTCKSLKF